MFTAKSGESKESAREGGRWREGKRGWGWGWRGSKREVLEERDGGGKRGIYIYRQPDRIR